MKKMKIIAIDDEPLLLTLMKEFIKEDNELEISETVTEKDNFLKLVQSNSFDAALIDISVDGREGGLELLQILKNKRINVPSIMLSAHDEGIYAIRCLQAGAQGYINKRNISVDLIKGLKAVCCGNLFVSGHKGEQILGQYNKSRTKTVLHSQ